MWTHAMAQTVDVERVALARALRNHLESRVLVHEGRTVVFD